MHQQRTRDGRSAGDANACRQAEVEWIDAADDEIEKYRTKFKPGTKARLALEVLLMTGHARSDVFRMGDQFVRDGRLSMSRKKTGAPFSIPLLPELVAELALHRRDGAVASMAWLTTERGTLFGCRCIVRKLVCRSVP